MCIPKYISTYIIRKKVHTRQKKNFYSLQLGIYVYKKNANPIVIAKKKETFSFLSFFKETIFPFF